MGTQRAKYTVQKVVMFDAETAAYIREKAESLGVSESEAVRQLVLAGIDSDARDYIAAAVEREGI